MLAGVHSEREKMIRIALLGLGTVGSRVYKHYIDDPGVVEASIGSRVEIARVLVRDLFKKRIVDVPQYKLTTDPRAILGDRKIDIVVSLLGNYDMEREYALIALAFRQRVVLANPVVTLRRELSAHHIKTHQFAIDREEPASTFRPAHSVWLAISRAATHIHNSNGT
ncbi:MAG: hypothetical protein Q7S47_01150 [bacterium]|nr:hypothetical protein [bacterium]